MDFIEFLKMTGATLGYVAVTAVLWIFYRKKEEHSFREKVLVGLIYGACSVLANHFGIARGQMLVLNVRDIGPLSAGLFFSPISGLIAGTIGGAERIMAGEIWGIGKFTELACGMSTFLAGVLSALLKRHVYGKNRPSMPQSFILGALMEVFHMYAVLFTNRSAINSAYYVVKSVSIPMILFTAVGMALCSMTVMKISGEFFGLGLRDPEERIPLAVLFQRSLLVVFTVLFAFNFGTSYSLQHRLMTEDASMDLWLAGEHQKDVYEGSGNNVEALKKSVSEQSIMLDYLYLLTDREFNVLAWNNPANTPEISEEMMTLFRENLDGDAFNFIMHDVVDIEFMGTVISISPEYYLVTYRSMAGIYDALTSRLYENTLSDILLFAVLYILVVWLAERLVVQNLHRVNRSLAKITGGDLKETVWVHTSAEFTDLSEDINQTVATLRGYISEAEERMKEELKLAAAIQDSALPKNFALPSENIELHALMTPAKTVGGDFYDFFYIGHDQLCLVIADVSGKGVPASLFMMRSKTAIKNYARNGMSPSEVLARVNHTLCEGNEAGMFVTVWLGILDLKTGLMQCANAGHEYPVLMRAGGNYELLKDKHGLVLAAMDGVKIPEYEIRLNPGDRIFVYTDGVPEAINEKNEAYGTERLTERLNRVKNNSEAHILEDILQDIRNFAGAAEQFDDITMLGLSFLDIRK